jgi:preprotein translocase subunit SecE
MARNDTRDDYPSLTGSQKRERTSPRTFLREVRGELRRVAWPSAKEVRSYSLVVLVTVTLLTIYVALLDAAFGRAMFQIFG